jgi:hypothetical protein
VITGTILLSIGSFALGFGLGGGLRLPGAVK